MKRTLIVRADADPEIGTGHVMRCLSLAQAWQDTGGEVVFAAADLPFSLIARLEREKILFEQVRATVGSLGDANHTAEIVRRVDAEWVVVDGYRFPSYYYEYLRESGFKVLALDDMAHLERYPVDVVLNQNLSATASVYHGRVEDDTELLLGPSYSLLRREFRMAKRRIRATAGSPRRVLVSFGGGDAVNFTGEILRNLIRSGRKDLDVVVLAGAANPNVPELRQLASTAPFSCVVQVNVENVAAVMNWADVAISAAGSTVWELAGMNVPALIGGFEENQLVGLKALGKISIFRAWPIEELLTRDLAGELDRQPVATGVQLTGFDAQGSVRVVDWLQTVGAQNRKLLSPV